MYKLLRSGWFLLCCHVALCINAEWRASSEVGVGLRSRASGSRRRWSSHSSEWKRSLRCLISSEEGRGENLLTQRTPQLQGIPVPPLATLGFICSNQKTSELPWSAPGLPTWDKWPVRKCRCYAFCWKLLEITLNSKPHWNMGSSSPAKPCVVPHFHPHAQDWLCEEALVGFQKFSVTTGHTSSLSLHALFLTEASS